MSKATFTRLAGSLLVLGGAFGGLAAFSQLQPGNHYNYYGIYQLLMWLSLPSHALLGLGIIGLALRYQHALGSAGRWLLTLSGIGALAIAIFMIGVELEDTLWSILMLVVAVHVIPLTIFGLLHLRRPTLPVFRALPLQIAVGWLVLVSDILRTDSDTLNNALTFLFFLGIGLAWLAIGLAVNRSERTAALATA